MLPPPPDATRRFSNRVADYVRYRPSYPEGVLAILRYEAGLRPGQSVADVGSGTGILSEMFLRNGNVVHGVEPNREMAEAAMARLGTDPRFHSIAGTAEATGLPAGSVDLVAAGQAFHWFDAAAAGREFRRILKPGGWVALVWNLRRPAGSPFLEGYENLVRRFGIDYKEVSERYAEESGVGVLFGPGGWRKHVLANRQELDLESLGGRLRSSSYTPPPGDPRHEPMLAALQELFASNARNGVVAFEYDTELYLGRL